jgi:hypothetical protein
MILECNKCGVEFTTTDEKQEYEQCTKGFKGLMVSKDTLRKLECAHKKPNFINGKQTKSERKIKYYFLRIAGARAGQAEKMKDWTFGHIIIWLNANSGACEDLRRSKKFKQWKRQRGLMKK